MADFKQILLGVKGCSGRGVRLRMLSPTQRAQITETAAKEIGPDGTQAAFRVRESTDAVCAMVAAVTDKTGIKTKAELVDAGITWKKVSVEDLAGDPGKYFNAKDVSALIQIYRSMHDVTEAEITDILGEAQDVTEA